MHARSRLLLRDLRGESSTHHLSSRLGYPSDVVAEWEAGRRWPTASELFRVCQLMGISVPRALHQFEPQAASALSGVDDDGVAAWLSALCREVDLGQLAVGTGRSRTVVRRWITGQVRPVLPDLLGLIDAATGRGEAFIEALLPTAPGPVPQAWDPLAAAQRRSEPARQAVRDALAEAWEVRNAARSGPEPFPIDEETVEVFVAAAARQSTSDFDPSEAVWRAIASTDYEALVTHRPAWLEARTGLSRDECLEMLHALEAAGAIRRGQDRWHLIANPPVTPIAADAATVSPIERLARLRAAQVVVPLAEEDVTRCRGLNRRTRPELVAIGDSVTGPRTLAMMRVID